MVIHDEAVNRFSCDIPFDNVSYFMIHGIQIEYFGIVILSYQRDMIVII